MMKKWFSRILSIALTLLLLLPLVPQRVEAAGVSLSGDSSLHPGESVTLTFSAGGSSIYALQASLNYDTDKLTMLGTSCLLGSDWNMDMSGSNIVLSDSQLNSPINNSQSVFSATFQVKDSVAAGETVSVSVDRVIASDGESDTSLGSASWSGSIASPVSSNAALRSLSCADAALSPSFSADTTSYRLTVPYSVASLDLSYQADDGDADVEVSGNDLSVGSNTVTITVTAPDGSTRHYTIAVTREEDPDYIPSADAALAKLTVSTGRLSPRFSPDVTSYVVYVPYEVTKIALTGAAKDSKAIGVTNASSKKLAEGDNLLQVSCTAEDGTVRNYEVHVWRMPQYAGILPEIISPDAAKPGPFSIVCAVLCTAVTIPLLSNAVGEVPLYIPVGAALVLLLLLVWLLGRLTGKHAGKKKLLRRMAAQQATEAETPAKSDTPAEPEAPVELPHPEEDVTSELDDVTLDELLDDIKKL